MILDCCRDSDPAAVRLFPGAAADGIAKIREKPKTVAHTAMLVKRIRFQRGISIDRSFKIQALGSIMPIGKSVYTKLGLQAKVITR
jgi:hypothetical protein